MKPPKRTLYKYELAEKLKLSSRSLSRFLKEREAKIKEIFPSYTRQSGLLFPKVIDYLIEENGYDSDEIYSYSNKTKSHVDKDRLL